MEKFKNTKDGKSPLNNRVLVARHFEDIDDVSEGLDTPLNFNSKDFEEVLSKVSKKIVEDSNEKGCNRILLLSSPRQRAVQTAEQIKLRIIKTEENLIVHSRIEERFAELDHGKIVIPEDYVSGKRIEFLKDAWRAFWSETFTDSGEYNNVLYKFGDPLTLDDGRVKYPELNGKFIAFGENYKSLSLRYYEALLEYFKSRERLKEAQINLLLIAHSATLSILTELQDIARDLTNGELNLQEGDLMKVCWQRYTQRSKEESIDIEYAETRFFQLGDISDDVISLLEREVQYMNNND